MNAIESESCFSVALFGVGYLQENTGGMKDRRYTGIAEERFWTGIGYQVVIDENGKTFGNSKRVIEVRNEIGES